MLQESVVELDLSFRQKLKIKPITQRMIEVNEDIATGNLAFRVSGELSLKEMSELKSLIMNKAANIADSHLLIIVEDFKGWAGFSGFRMSRQLYAKCADYFDRIAVVNDFENLQQTSEYFGTFTDGELKIFSIDEAEYAWNWINQNPHF